MNVHKTSKGFHQVWYQGGMKSTVAGILEDPITFKISEGSDQNWCFPGSALLAVSAKLYMDEIAGQLNKY